MKTKYLAVGLLFATGLFGQSVAPALTPTEVQSLRLQVKQKDAQIAQKEMQEATVKFQGALTDLQNEGKKVVTENKWPDTTVFDPNTLRFSEAPKPEPAKAPAVSKK
jgi:hypothetical protein